MKNVPDIAPEIRGLLEEIVADPCSSIRFAPRKALSSWFETGETARAREISSTRAERHLIEEHREALAELLCEAAWIAYWKAPVLAHRPIGTDGRLFDPTQREPALKLRSERFMKSNDDTVDGISLLRCTLTGIGVGEAPALAQASLSLISTDKTRCYVALTLPSSRARSSIEMFSHLVAGAYPKSLRCAALVPLAAKLCIAGRLNDAREAYRRDSLMSPSSPYGRIYSFSLSCVLGDVQSALREATALEAVIAVDDPRLAEACSILSTWTRSRTGQEIVETKVVCERVVDELPECAKVLSTSLCE